MRRDVVGAFSPGFAHGLIRRFRGAARLRSMARGAWLVSLDWGKSRDGLTLALNPEEYIDRFILKCGYYERDVLDAILANLPEAGVLWDVGAHIGLHALTVKLLRPDSKVVAFEPAPLTLSRLVMNAHANNLDIETFSSALGEHGGYAGIALKLRGNSGLSSLKPWPNTEYDATIKCRVDRADELVSAGMAPKPSVIKIDVEGCEVSVLSGAAGLLDDPTLKAVIFESNLKRLDAISSLLNGHGFSIKGIAQVNRDESALLTPNYLASRPS